MVEYIVRETDAGEWVASAVHRDTTVAEQLRQRFELRRAASRQKRGTQQGVRSAGDQTPVDHVSYHPDTYDAHSFRP